MGVIEALRTLRAGAMRGLGVGPIELIRGRILPGDASYLIDEYAVARFKLEAVFRTGWRAFSDRELDKAKADWAFGLGWSRVYVQVKGATLDKNGQWGPHIFPYGKSLDMGFYEGESSYLGLVLFHLTHKEFKSLAESRQLGPMEIEATVLMLDGDRVIRYFEPHDPKTHSGMMRFSKKMYEEGGYGWLEGTEDLGGMFAGERRQQERERGRRARERGMPGS